MRRGGVVNLDGHVQNVQLRVGVGVLAVGLVGAVAMNAAGVGLRAHLLLVPVFAIGAYGICAGLTRTCALTAIAGRRFTATGTEPIADRDELSMLRRRGMTVLATSLLIAVLATVLLSSVSR